MDLYGYEEWEYLESESSDAPGRRDSISTGRSEPHEANGKDECNLKAAARTAHNRDKKCLILWKDEEQRQPSTAGDGLCSVCQKINHVAETQLRPSCFHSPKNNWHLHLGLLKGILENTSCPGCRLIASLAKAVPKTEPDGPDYKDTSVTIRPRFPHARYLSQVPEPEDAPIEAEHENAWTMFSQMESSLSVVFEDCFVPVFSKTMMIPAKRVAGTIVRKDKTGRHWTNFNLHLEEGDESDIDSHQIRGLAVSSEVDVARFKHWIEHCGRRHYKCHVPSRGLTSAQQIRLIDVRDWRIVTAALDEKYIALSYVWGSDAKPILTNDRLLNLSLVDGLKGLDLPKTISDAMRLVRDLGERYLWVDSVCIVQDDEVDKLQQLSVMADVYESADIVVVAAAGQDAEVGLPGLYGSRRRPQLQQAETIGGVEFITTQPDIQEVLRWSVWNSRGWTFQESILSNRALIFTEGLVYWSCQVETWREDLNSDSAPGAIIPTDSSSLWGTGLAESGRKHKCRTLMYCEHVEPFTWRNFKDQSDVLWAFMGVLRKLGPKFPKGYIWGLPYDRLDATLLWQPVSNSCGSSRHPRVAKHKNSINDHKQNLPFPSWSWLSTETPISFLDTCGSGVISEVVWYEPMLFDGIGTDENQVEIVDYGYLQFGARTAQLILRLQDGYATPPVPETPVEATIHDSADKEAKQIGTIATVYGFFKGNTEQVGEFVLLSSNAERKADGLCRLVDRCSIDCGSIVHVDGCEHVQSRNIMLIEWDGEVAFRRGLTKMAGDDWDALEAEEKDIVLG
ncbi:hypothetical protein OQA88_8014 [Cercophora sp. LCS_1]